MHRFWNAYTGPLIETLQPRRLLEIGAEFGWNTRHALDYCARAGGHLDVVDTVPLKSLRDTLAAFPEATYALHACKSVEIIPALGALDFVLLDGDHNWRTVYAELTQLYATAERAGQPPPVVVAHDCAWPYARRDMYYSPDEFREIERKPYAYRAIQPGVAELQDDGLNGHFANALVEGGPENGVLTAIEDFVQSRAGVGLHVLPFFNGLGVIVPEARRTPELDTLLARFFGGEMMLDACRALEEDGMKVRVDLTVQRRQLVRRTEALTRARHMLQDRAETIAALTARLEAIQAAGAPAQASDHQRDLVGGVG